MIRASFAPDSSSSSRVNATACTGPVSLAIDGAPENVPCLSSGRLQRNQPSDAVTISRPSGWWARSVDAPKPL